MCKEITKVSKKIKILVKVLKEQGRSRKEIENLIADITNHILIDEGFNYS